MDVNAQFLRLGALGDLDVERWCCRNRGRLVPRERVDWFDNASQVWDKAEGDGAATVERDASGRIGAELVCDQIRRQFDWG
ncbi:MAG: hypothetical protein ACLP22_20675 [Solirubrobacteraceae bacterium]|jgi:hypothetical protein